MKNVCAQTPLRSWQKAFISRQLQLIAGPEYTGAFKPFSMCALLAELQVLHPQAQALAREAASLLDAAFRISEEWKRLDAQSTAFVQENPIDAQPAPFVHEDPNARIPLHPL